MNRRHLLLITFYAALGGIVGVALTTALTVRAGIDNNPATDGNAPLVLPWEGTLELDGLPADGSMDLRFSLWNDANVEVWSEDYTAASGLGQVPITGGRFSVALGRGNSVVDCIADGEPLTIRVSVPDGQGGWTLLSGGSPLDTSPYALWSTRAAHVVAAGEVKVGASTTVGDAGINVYGTSAPHARLGNLSIDSAQNLGYADVVAGASTDGANYFYHGTRGATRLRFDDESSHRFSVQLSNPAAGTPGGTVTFETALHVNASNQIGIGRDPQRRLDVAGTITADNLISTGTFTSGTVTSTGDMALAGVFNVDGTRAMFTGTTVITGTSLTSAGVDIGVSTATHHCIVGGSIGAPSGNDMTGHTLRTDKSGSTWEVRAHYHAGLGFPGPDWETEAAWFCIANTFIDSSSSGLWFGQ